MYLSRRQLGKKTVTPVMKAYAAVAKDREVLRKGGEMKGGCLVINIKKCISVAGMGRGKPD